MDKDAILSETIDPRDIDSVDNFKRQTKRAIARLHRTGRPHVLTLNGRPAVVVQDARAYAQEQSMAGAQAGRDTLFAIRQGIAHADRGDLRDADEVFEELPGTPSKLKARSR